MLMLGVYGWALITSTKKLYYNLIITSISALFALFIAFIEIFGMIAEGADVSGPFWDFIGEVGDSFEFVGGGLVVASVVGWGFAASIFYGQGYYLVDRMRGEEGVVVVEGVVTTAAVEGVVGKRSPEEEEDGGVVVDAVMVGLAVESSTATTV